ncbi:cobalamin synthase [Marinitoga sp. 1197]|uniref:adenosylcobinamide-GDP ribazoletransferase n=1 Tax=unclassified Marinitoga TaxID=2640159 RepID=UPI000640DF44|nr:MULTISPECIES: adenosylcobinamide-GDP ribazoletransferase [unclassified Marinitoga]KLO22303.1 cobalamin synthase [Marinitoga sp. 1155]KLO22964.1 cobalamin synthase [Marinitoga sp. 1197]
MKSIILIITFFTRIPIKYNFEFNEKDFAKGILFLPLLGLFIGFFMYVFSIFEPYLDKSIIILMIWIFYIWITGGLHIDGVADSFDGIFSNRSKERILEIMRDSRIGTFGVLGLFMVFAPALLLSYYLDYKFLILTPAIGRISAILAASFSEYARKEQGIGNVFIDNCGLKEALFSMILILIISIVIFNKYILIPIILSFLMVILITKYIKSKIGGMTGDTIGLIIESSQSIFLFLLYIFRGVLS